MRKHHALLLTTGLDLFWAPAALAAPPPPQPHDAVSRGHWALLGAVALTNLGLLVGQSTFAPTHCVWCEVDDQGRSTLNRFDAGARRRLRWQHPQRAHRWSNVSALGALPLATLGASALALRTSDWHDPELMRDVWQIAMSTSLTLLVNQVVKTSVGRERPYVHAMRFSSGQTRPYRSSSGDRLSFFSGHSALSFALATSTSVVMTRRLGAQAAWIWGGSLLCAGSTAWLRIAADKHYATDVITGALIGTAFGLGMTLLPDMISLPGMNPANKEVSVAISSRMIGLQWSGRF